MRKRIFFLFSIGAILFLSSCASLVSHSRGASATTTGPRTIILDGVSVSALDTEGFISWYGVDSRYESEVLVELGYFGSSEYSELGFVLHDGGYEGSFTSYGRKGLDHRWDWGPNGYEFVFIIKPDGTGLYYDFTFADDGESLGPKDEYYTYRRKDSKNSSAE